jgi:hypothetical protein
MTLTSQQASLNQALEQHFDAVFTDSHLERFLQFAWGNCIDSVDAPIE